MEELSLRAMRAFSGVPDVWAWRRQTALLLIDMQVSCIRSDGHTLSRLRELGLTESVNQYYEQLEVVIPNLQRVLARARQSGQPVIHTHVVSLGLESDGARRSLLWAPPGSDESHIIEELAPAPGEFVLPKACSGVFTGTNIDYLLRRLGVTSLIVGGVVTHGCVERAITEGYDRGYAFVLLSDGSASLTNELHHNALERLGERRAHVVTTNWLLDHDHVPASSIILQPVGG